MAVVESPVAPELGREATEPVSEALADAYRDHRDAVFHVARRICGQAAAEDVTQDVFFQFWRRPGTFDPTRGTLRTFLLTMAHSRALDVVRSESRRRIREESSHEPATGPMAAPADGYLLEREAASQVSYALTRLPQRERDALVKVFWEPCTYRDAARMLSLPEGTTKSRIRSGLERLRVVLADSPNNIQPSEGH